MFCGFCQEWQDWLSLISFGQIINYEFILVVNYLKIIGIWIFEIEKTKQKANDWNLYMHCIKLFEISRKIHIKLHRWHRWHRWHR